MPHIACKAPRATVGRGRWKNRRPYLSPLLPLIVLCVNPTGPAQVHYRCGPVLPDRAYCPGTCGNGDETDPGEQCDGVDGRAVPGALRHDVYLPVRAPAVGYAGVASELSVGFAEVRLDAMGEIQLFSKMGGQHALNETAWHRGVQQPPVEQSPESLPKSEFREREWP